MTDYEKRDRLEAERIRRQYESREERKIEALRALDRKVKRPGEIAALSLGIIGALLLGSGMSLIIVWENMTGGLLLGIPGLITAILAFPLYTVITTKRKERYSAEIIQLSYAFENNAKEGK